MTVFVIAALGTFAAGFVGGFLGHRLARRLDARRDLRDDWPQLNQWDGL